MMLCIFYEFIHISHANLEHIKDEDMISVLKQIEDHIKDEYIKSRPEKKRDWRTYEQMDAERIMYAIKSLDPLIHEAVSAIHIDDSGPGRPSPLTRRSSFS